MIYDAKKSRPFKIMVLRESEICVLRKTGSRSSNPSSKRRVVLMNIEEEHNL